MIKKIILFLILIPGFVFADFEISDYKFKKDVKAPEDKTGDFSFTIDSEIYKNADQFFHDLRVIDKNKKEVPFLIEKDFDKKKANFIEEEFKIISQKDSTYILDLGKNKEKYYQWITVDTDSRDFSRVVDVYGSHLENSRFEKISNESGSLIFSGPSETKKEIHFRYTDYRFLKLVFSGNEGDFSVKRFFARKNKPIEVLAEKKINKTSFEEIQTENSQEQHVLVTLEDENIPTDQFFWYAKNKNFDRVIDIFSSDRADAKFLESGKRYNKNETYWKKIYSKKYSKKIYSDFPWIEIHDNKKYYLFVIHNGDNEKLDITKIDSVRYLDTVYLSNLDFINNSYSVFYGNVFAKKSSYDLQNIAKNKEKSLTLDKEVKNAVYKEPKKNIQEELPYLIYIFIIFMVLILFWFVYRVLHESGSKRKKDNRFVNKL